MKIIGYIRKAQDFSMLFCSEKLKIFPLDSRTVQDVNYIIPLHNSIEIYSQNSYVRKEIKDIDTGKKEAELLSIIDGIILYKKPPKLS